MEKSIFLLDTVREEVTSYTHTPTHTPTHTHTRSQHTDEIHTSSLRLKHMYGI